MLDDAKAFEVPVGTLQAGTVGNRLLASLPGGTLERIAPALRTTMVVPGQTLLEPGQGPTTVVFPAGRTVVTMLSVLKDRKPVETAMIGAEGATGAIFGPDVGSVPARCMVLTPGPVLTLDATSWGAVLDESPEARRLVLRYATAFMAQLGQGVACAAVHPVEQRAARWMLALEDRLGDRSLPLTQEQLADLLGVRRTTITRVIANLEGRGLIRHRRSRIIVVDRAGLERASCECHGATRDQFAALAPGLYPARPSEG